MARRPLTAPEHSTATLSWLEFNRRVLAQAADDRVPLLERVKFLAIFSSNLDEFFMKRVGLIKRQCTRASTTALADGTPRASSCPRSAQVVNETCRAEQARSIASCILPELARGGHPSSCATRTCGEGPRVGGRLVPCNVFPALTPLAVDPTHRFPFISNLSDNLAVVRAPGARCARRRRGVSRSLRA
jgi:polyphosphate kinase